MKARARRIAVGNFRRDLQIDFRVVEPQSRSDETVTLHKHASPVVEPFDRNYCFETWSDTLTA